MFTTKTENNYALPWQMRPQRSSTGSAFVSSAKKRFILTNSHVVGSAQACCCQETAQMFGRPDARKIAPRHFRSQTSIYWACTILVIYRSRMQPPSKFVGQAIPANGGPASSVRAGSVTWPSSLWMKMNSGQTLLCCSSLMRSLNCRCVLLCYVILSSCCWKPAIIGHKLGCASR